MCIVRRVTVQSGTTSSINTLVPSVTVAKTDDSDGSFCLDAEVRRSRIRHGESSPPESSSRAPPHARRCQVRVDTSFLKGSNVLRLFRVCLSGRDEKSLRAVRQGWKPEGPRPEGAWFTTARPSPRKSKGRNQNISGVCRSTGGSLVSIPSALVLRTIPFLL